MIKPTAKKVPGCGFWTPAVSGSFGPTVIQGSGRYDTPYAAKKAATELVELSRIGKEIISDMYAWGVISDPNIDVPKLGIYDTIKKVKQFINDGLITPSGTPYYAAEELIARYNRV